jgi:hypothetical protein
MKIAQFAAIWAIEPNLVGGHAVDPDNVASVQDRIGFVVIRPSRPVQIGNLCLMV